MKGRVDEYMSEGEINNWVINESNDNSTEDQDYDIVTGGRDLIMATPEGGGLPFLLHQVCAGKCWT